MKTKNSLIMLGSGEGSTIDFFCNQIQSQRLPLEVTSIITENPQAGVISVAKKYKIPCHVISYNKDNPSGWDESLCDILLDNRPDLILLAGFLKKIGPKVLSQFENRILNSHPALISDFAGLGMYGSRIHQAVIEQKKKETGITIHFVNEGYDEGQILHEQRVQVQKEETPLELEQRVKIIEKSVYLKTVLQFFSS